MNITLIGLTVSYYKNEDTMKTLSVCNPDFQKIYPQSIIDLFSFSDNNISIGLLPIEYSNNRSVTNQDVLVEVNAFSCNYRDRAAILNAHNSCITLGRQSKIAYAGFGSDFIAIVKKVGSKVKYLKEGDRVIPDCMYYDTTSEFREGVPTNFASQRMHIFNENKLIKIPDEMPDEVAASFSIASQTSYSMIRKASIKKHDKILITAATSNTSLATIKAAKKAGAKVFVTSSNPKNEKTLLDWGADVFIPIEAFINGKLDSYIESSFFDVVIDPYYDLYINGVIKHINYNGKYIFCGFCEQYEQLDKESLFFREDYKNIFIDCMVRNISIIGNCIGLRSDLENAIEDYIKSDYNILIDSVYSGSDFISFLNQSFKNPSRIGKVVYVYND